MPELRRLGVTSAPTLVGCPLRYQLEHTAPARGGERFSAPAALGDLCHAALQHATETRGILSEAWEEHLEGAWDRAVGLLKTSDDVGPAESWPGAKVARARLLGVAGRLREILIPLGDDVELICEESMTALEGQLVGKPDLIVRSPNSHWIVDYKTGTVLDAESGLPKSEYVSQLQLYAALEHSRAGVWPTRGILVPFVQANVDVELDPAQCEQLANSVAAAIDAFNQRLDGEQPASPSPDHCQWCRVATECEAVWQQCEESWAPQVTLVEGQVAQAARSQTGLMTIVVDAATGTIEPGRIAIQVGSVSDDLQLPVAGEALRASGVRRRREQTFQLSPWGQLRIGHG